MKKLLVEFIGTTFLCMVIGMVAGGTPLAPVAIGSVLMVMVYMGGHISGAHYNPAVSLAVMLRGKISVGEMLQYWVAQLLGGLVGAGVALWLRGEPTPLMTGSGFTDFQALIAEIIFTFALALVVLNVATSRDTDGNSYYGLAIGFTVAMGAFSVGNISGGAFNPAVGIGHDAVAKAWSPMWIYIVGPFSGAILAALIYKATNDD